MNGFGVMITSIDLRSHNSGKKRSWCRISRCVEEKVQLQAKYGIGKERLEGQSGIKIKVLFQHHELGLNLEQGDDRPISNFLRATCIFNHGISQPEIKI